VLETFETRDGAHLADLPQFAATLAASLERERVRAVTTPHGLLHRLKARLRRG
jgi:hypothetical protein